MLASRFRSIKDDLDVFSGQAVLLEEGSKVALSLLAPIMNDNPFGLKFDQVQLASPGDEPDDANGVRRGQFEQAFPGPLKDWMLRVFQGPGHGIVNGPRLAGFSVQEPERCGISLADRNSVETSDNTAVLRKPRRFGGRLKKDMQFTLRFGHRTKAAPNRLHRHGYRRRFWTTVLLGSRLVGVVGEAPSARLDEEKTTNYCRGATCWQGFTVDGFLEFLQQVAGVTAEFLGGDLLALLGRILPLMPKDNHEAPQHLPDELSRTGGASPARFGEPRQELVQEREGFAVFGLEDVVEESLRLLPQHPQIVRRRCRREKVGNRGPESGGESGDEIDPGSRRATFEPCDVTERNFCLFRKLCLRHSP